MKGHCSRLHKYEGLHKINKHLNSNWGLDKYILESKFEINMVCFLVMLGFHLASLEKVVKIYNTKSWLRHALFEIMVVYQLQ